MAVGSKWNMKAEDVIENLMRIADLPYYHKLSPSQKEAIDITVDVMTGYHKFLMPEEKKEHKPIPDKVLT